MLRGIFLIISDIKGFLREKFNSVAVLLHGDNQGIDGDSNIYTKTDWEMLYYGVISIIFCEEKYIKVFSPQKPPKIFLEKDKKKIA